MMVPRFAIRRPAPACPLERRYFEAEIDREVADKDSPSGITLLLG